MTHYVVGVGYLDPRDTMPFMMFWTISDWHKAHKPGQIWDWIGVSNEQWKAYLACRISADALWASADRKNSASYRHTRAPQRQEL